MSSVPFPAFCFAFDFDFEVGFLKESGPESELDAESELHESESTSELGGGGCNWDCGGGLLRVKLPNVRRPVGAGGGRESRSTSLSSSESSPPSSSGSTLLESPSFPSSTSPSSPSSSSPPSFTTTIFFTPSSVFILVTNSVFTPFLFPPCPISSSSSKASATTSAHPTTCTFMPPFPFPFLPSFPAPVPFTGTANANSHIESPPSSALLRIAACRFCSSSASAACRARWSRLACRAAAENVVVVGAAVVAVTVEEVVRSVLDVVET
ncbi:hypothetical protein BDZ91DRAFT_738802 [Kalaharituber pfeilii]|nr:hypothetical protein BDZ91DRAFT_738802 [Kalaharituber pfeilii]